MKKKLLLKTWRPISLLNVCYNIASGSIANRLKYVLDSITNKDQTVFFIKSVFEIKNYCRNLIVVGIRPNVKVNVIVHLFLACIHKASKFFPEEKVSP